MRTSLRAAFAAAATLALLAPGVAFADNINTSAQPDFTYSTATKVLALQSGSSRGVTFDLVPTNNDSQNNCNMTGNGSITLGVHVAPVPGQPVATLSGLPSTLTLAKTSTANVCDVNVVMNVTGGAPGSAMVSFSVDSISGQKTGVTLSDFDTSPATFRVNVSPSDSTPPQISYTLNPAAPGAGGWYSTPVSIHWTVTDPESSPSGCADQTWSTQTTAAGHDFTCSASSAGGSAGPVTVNVKLDTTVPTAVPSVSGPSSNGWYNGDNTLHWTVGDALSGLVDPNACPDVPLTSDTTGTTYSCTDTDVAGNSTTSSITIKHDASVPLISSAVSGTLNAATGWYTSQPSVTWTVSDPTSEIASKTGCVNQTVADTSGVSLGCSATNGAGLSATAPDLTLKVDSVAPVVAANVSGAQGNAPWYVGDVTVDWTYTEAGSGVSDACTVGHQTDDTTGTDFSCTVHDAAGNTSNTAAVTIKKDATKPTVSHGVAGTLGHNGWYVGDVVVTFTRSDATSNIATEVDCDPARLQADTASVTYECTVTDVAGNTRSDNVTVKRDATAPVIAHNALNPDGQTDWFVTHPSLDWTVTEPVSAPVTLTGCDDVASVPDTNGTTYSCKAVNDAGLEATDAVSVKVDTVAPVVTGTPSGNLGAHGWYVGDVTVAWTVDEAGSGATPCRDDHQTADSAGASFQCQVSDVAGNASNLAEVTVKRDTLRPTVTPHVNGDQGAHGWYVGDVTVSFDVADATSGVDTAVGCGSAVVDTDTSGRDFDCVVTDRAGLQAESAFTVKRDASKPVITHNALTSDGQHGWFVTHPSLDWTVTESVSTPVAVTGCDDVTSVPDTNGTTYDCKAVNDAGLEATDSVSLKVDTVAPVAVGAVSGPVGDNGWYVGDVTVDWSYVEDGSGVVTPCDQGHQTSDTTGTAFSCQVSDQAGWSSATASVSVKRDATKPDLDFASGPADGAAYDFGDPIPATSCSASDGTSGLTAACTVTPVSTTVGPHTVTAFAKDKAGNQHTITHSYMVRAWRLDGFYKPVTMGTTYVNTVKAGSTVPLKFNVYKGTQALTSGIGATFIAKKINCDGTDIATAVDEFATTGQTVLRYDGTGAQWIQNWATPSSGRGSCYRTTVTTADGSAIWADFLLK